VFHGKLHGVTDPRVLAAILAAVLVVLYLKFR
jgi:hypothetical protein